MASAGSRTLLFTGAAGLAKLGCSVWMLVLSMAVSDMEVFAQEGVMPNVTLELGASGLMRFCACDVGTDPLGRGGKKRGALTSDALCSACHEPTDLVHFRRSLSRASERCNNQPSLALSFVRLVKRVWRHWRLGAGSRMHAEVESRP